MYSEFFLQVLIDMDESPDSQINSNGFREPIILPEQDPDEAASFLNMLHTSSLNQDSREWNIAHARLSVHWQIESLIAEYAYQIECHVNRILNTIDMNQFYEKSPEVFSDLTVSFWSNGSPITSKLQSMKISGSNLNICFSCNPEQVSRFILASEVHNLIIFREEEADPILEIKVTESISRNLKFGF